MSGTDKPIVAAAVAVTATIGLAIVMVKEIILPTHVAGITHEGNMAKKELANSSHEKALLQKDIALLQAEKVTLAKQVEELKGKNKTLSNEIFVAQNANAFFKGSAYPVGLEKVKVGDKFELIEMVFPKASVRKEKKHLIVEDQHSVFVRVYYTYSPDAMPQKVRSIRFELDRYKRLRAEQPSVAASWIAESLARSLGPASMVGEDKECMFWPLGDSKFVYHQPSTDWFWVMDNSAYPPGCWALPEDEPKKK